MNEKKHNQKKIFKILVVENDPSFYEILVEIISGCLELFPFLKFDVGRASTNDEYGTPDMRDYDLVFIEDNALNDLKKQETTIAFVLLLNSYFFKQHATQIKKMISKKSLNLYEHISLTNYPFDLMKLLVVDFIKNKIKWSTERKTPNSRLLSY